MRGQTQLATWTPDGNPTSARWLSQLGGVDSLALAWANPGGCQALTANFRRPPNWRSDALNPGRLISACRGGTWTWAGILDEPQPADDGWAISAHGAGGYSDDYLAIYSVAWGTGVFNDAVDQAIARGLDWVRGTDIGSVAGIWTGQQVDSGTQTITDLLNLGCQKGGLTWSVTTTASGNVLTVYPLPTTANRILIAVNPEGRTIGDGPSDLYARYQATWDSGTTPATYALTSVANTAERAAHGRREQLMDISSAGVYTAGQAQGIASAVMKRYVRAAFADPFVVQPGELLTEGGRECDLGTYWADGLTAMVCEAWLGDYSYGGESVPGIATFLTGTYEWDEDSDAAAVTPIDSELHDFATLLGAAVDATPVRVQPTATAAKKVKKAKPGGPIRKPKTPGKGVHPGGKLIR